MGEDKVEVYSVDEAFIEVDVPPENWEALGRMLKARVEQWTGIQVSVGIARSKVLSKLANRLSKKDKKGSGGVMTLRNEQDWERALRQTALSDLWGIGRRYGEKLREQWGMETAWQLAAMPESWAGKQLGGVNGIRLHRELRGLPSISLKDPLEKKKAIACTRMFGRPVNRLSEIKEAIAAYISRAAEKLRRQEAAACGIEVFLIHKEAGGAARAYETGINKNCLQLPMPASSTGELIRRALPLAEAIFEPGRHYIKAGVQLFDLVPDQLLQGNLFEEGSGIRQAPLMKVMDNINFSMKAETVRFAASGTARSWKMRRELCSKAYTTSWKDLPELH
jgi:DNA polymerase V